MNPTSSIPSDSRSTFKSQAPLSRILLVDDSTTILQVYRLALESSGRELVGVTNGVDALKEAMAKPFNLILLDIQMPGMDGLEVCRQLKLDPRTQPIPVLFVSGTKNEEAGLDLGAVGFLHKPFALAALREAVEKWESPAFPAVKHSSKSKHLISAR